jgi:hypothetical protein
MMNNKRQEFTRYFMNEIPGGVTHVSSVLPFPFLLLHIQRERDDMYEGKKLFL